MIKNRLSSEARTFFNNKFNILHEVDLLYTDDDFSSYQDMLNNAKKEVYDEKDKFLVIHYDTDYYLPHCPYGLTMFNLVKTFIQLDIPLHNMILVTNHVGIISDLKHIIPKHISEKFYPIVIDNMISIFKDYAKVRPIVSEVPFDPDNITTNAICMMGVKRIHRNIIFNQIKDTSNNIAISYNNIKS